MDDYDTCRKLGKSYFPASKLPYVCHCGHLFFSKSWRDWYHLWREVLWICWACMIQMGPFKDNWISWNQRWESTLVSCGFACVFSMLMQWVRKVSWKDVFSWWFPGRYWKPFKLKFGLQGRVDGTYRCVATFLPCLSWVVFCVVVASMAGWDPDEWSDL